MLEINMLKKYMFDKIPPILLRLIERFPFIQLYFSIVFIDNKIYNLI
jgi:hypothetical protein